MKQAIQLFINHALWHRYWLSFVTVIGFPLAPLLAFLWSYCLGGNGVPGGNPPVRLEEYMSMSNPDCSDERPVC